MNVLRMSLSKTDDARTTWADRMKGALTNGKSLMLIMGVSIVALYSMLRIMRPVSGHGSSWEEFKTK
eukprot:SAG22_NODE_10572_length_527_cov_0.848131_1_plen_66_part_10